MFKTDKALKEFGKPDNELGIKVYSLIVHLWVIRINSDTLYNSNVTKWSCKYRLIELITLITEMISSGYDLKPKADISVKICLYLKRVSLKTTSHFTKTRVSRHLELISISNTPVDIFIIFKPVRRKWWKKSFPNE